MDNIIVKDIEDLANKLIRTNWLINGEIYNLYKKGWNFRFNNKKRALGTCSYINKEITLSKPLIESNHDLILWDDTMRHEIAHAIDSHIRGKSDHSSKWKNVAMQVGCSVELLKSKIKVNSAIGKYTLKCNVCDTEVHIHRKRKKEGACSSCCKTHNNGYYSDKFKLQVIQNY